MEATFQIRIPRALLDLGFDREQVQQQAVEWMVTSLFVQDRISSGKAARLLGISRIDFLRLLRKNGVAFVNYSAEELEDELAAADELGMARTA